MSNEVHPAESGVQRRNYVLTILGVIASFLLFLVILLIAYIPNRPASVNQEIVAARKLKLSELSAKQSQQMNSYSWVNEKEGQVRIPVKRAMELLVQQQSGSTTQSTVQSTNLAN